MRMKKQGTGWERIFAKHTSGKRLVSRIEKELLKLQNKKTTLLKMDERPSHLEKAYRQQNAYEKMLNIVFH